MIWKRWHHFSSTKIFTTRLEFSECNRIGRSEGGVIKEKKKSSTGRKDREIIKGSWSSKDKVGSGEYILRRPPKKPGGEETDEVDTPTTISRASVTTLKYTTYANIH